MAKIREDLEGAVHVDGYVLFAGDEVPKGVHVGAHLTGVKPTVEDDEFDPLAEEPAPAKPRGRPRKTK